MKPNIHPQWHHDAVVTCSCGNSFVTGATAATISVDICSKCHPFFTGEMRFVDRQGRVDKFKKKMEHAAKNAGKTTKATKRDDKKPEEVLSYRQILEQQRTEIKKAAQA